MSALPANRRTQQAGARLGLCALLGALSACAEIVGIEDTTVTRGDGGGEAQNAAGEAGAAHSGGPNAGQSNDGGTPSGGTETGGAR